MENIKKMARPPPNADYTFLVGDPNFDNLTNRCWWNGTVLVSWWFYRSAMFQHRELGNRFRTKDSNSQQACDKAILNYYEYSRNKAIEFLRDIITAAGDDHAENKLLRDCEEAITPSLNATLTLIGVAKRWKHSLDLMLLRSCWKWQNIGPRMYQEWIVFASWALLLAWRTGEVWKQEWIYGICFGLQEYFLFLRKYLLSNSLSLIFL